MANFSESRSIPNCKKICSVVENSLLSVGQTDRKNLNIRLLFIFYTVCLKLISNAGVSYVYLENIPEGVSLSLNSLSAHYNINFYACFVYLAV